MVLFSDRSYIALQTDVDYLKKIVGECLERFDKDDTADHIVMMRLKNVTDSIDRSIRECQR